MDDPYSAETLRTKAILYDVVVRYCRGVDRVDFDLLRTVFHDDAIYDYGGEYFCGTIAEWFEYAPKGRAVWGITQHHVTNTEFQVDGDRAEGETYIIAHHLFSEPPHQFYTAGCRYLDKFSRKNGVWRISHRTAVQDWENMTGSPNSPHKGSIGKDDLSYRVLSMFGAPGAGAGH